MEFNLRYRVIRAESNHTSQRRVSEQNAFTLIETMVATAVATGTWTAAWTATVTVMATATDSTTRETTALTTATCGHSSFSNLHNLNGPIPSRSLKE